MKRTVFIATLALLLCLTLVAPAFAETPDISQQVDLVMYLIGSPAPDYDEMLEQLNAKMAVDLNATLTVNWVGWGDFGTKYPLILASGEPVDLIYASTWTNYYSEVAKGAFLPLEDLLPVYAPKTYADITPDFMKQATVNGHLYGIPASFYQVGMMGYIMRGDFLAESGIIESEGVAGYGDFTIDHYGMFMDYIKNNHPEIQPGDYMATSDALDSYFAFSQNLYTVTVPFYIDLSADEPVVVNFYDLPDSVLLPHFNKMKEWGDKGYWSKTVLSDKEENKFRDGKAASRLHNQDSWKTTYNTHPEYDAKYYFGAPYAFKTAAMQDGLAVPAAAKNPERALMLVEKLRQDEEYYDLMTYGIKGKHWELNENGELIPLDADGFAPEGYCSWGFKEIKFFKPPVGMPANLDEVNAALDDLATINPYTLFFADYEPIKNERAAVFNVWQQYGLPLAYGYVDVESGLATVREKMAAAGAETMRAELERQLREFLAE